MAREANPRLIGERYESGRLYCTTCTVQPEYFREVIHWQVNRVKSNGTEIDNEDGSLEYQCPGVARLPRGATSSTGDGYRAIPSRPPKAVRIPSEGRTSLEAGIPSGC